MLEFISKNWILLLVAGICVLFLFIILIITSKKGKAKVERDKKIAKGEISEASSPQNELNQDKKE